MEFQGLSPWKRDVGIIEVHTERGVVDLFNDSTLVSVCIQPGARSLLLRFDTPIGSLGVSFGRITGMRMEGAIEVLNTMGFWQFDYFGGSAELPETIVIYFTEGELAVEAGLIATEWLD